MSLTAVETWKRLLDLARREIPEQTFRTWLEPTEALTLSGDILSIGVPDQFAADWNESKHADLFASYAPIALGHPLKVVFRVHEERKKRSQMDFFVAPPAASSATVKSQQAANRLQLSDRYTFNHFVI